MNRAFVRFMLCLIVTGSVRDLNIEDHRRKLTARSLELLTTSVFALCPRGNGPSSIRFVEAIASGAIPVLIGDWTTPFDEDLCGFVVRWSTRSPARLDLLVRLLRSIASDHQQLEARRRNMWEFAKRHHPVWFDTR